MPLRANPSTGQWEEYDPQTDAVQQQVHKEIKSDPASAAPQVDLHAQIGDSGVKELTHLPIDEDGNTLYNLGTPPTQPMLDNITKYSDGKAQVKSELDKLANLNPVFYSGLPGAFQKTTNPVVMKGLATALDWVNDVTLKPIVGEFNSFYNLGKVIPAHPAMLMSGVYSVANGDGTFLDGMKSFVDGFKEAYTKNEGFADSLRNKGVPNGPEFQLAPKIGFNMLAGFLGGTADNTMQGKWWGPKVTPLGAVGLAGDIALNPLTYIGIFPHTPANKIINGVKPVITFGEDTLLNSEQLSKHFQALKSTKVGQGIYNMMDRLLGMHLFNTVTPKEIMSTTQDAFGKALIPNYGPYKNIGDSYYKIQKEIQQSYEGIDKSFGEMSKNFTPEERASMFRGKLQDMMDEKIVGKGNLPVLNFSDPKQAEAWATIANKVNTLAKKVGYDKDMFNNYIYSVFEDSYSKASSVPSIVKLRQDPSRFVKTFVQNKDLIQDPFIAMGTKLKQLVAMERINNGFIKPIVEQYGKDAEYLKSLDKGIGEFLGTDGTAKSVKDVFKGTDSSYENAKLFDNTTKPLHAVNNQPLTVAAKIGDKIYEGKPGTIHAQIPDLPFLPQEQLNKAEMGFIHPDTGKFLTREQATQYLKDATTEVKSQADLAKSTFLPSGVVEKIKELGQQSKLNANQLLKVYDAYTSNVFKPLNTVLSPAFHAKVLINGFFRDFQQFGFKAMFDSETATAAHSIIADSEGLGQKILNTTDGKALSYAKIQEGFLKNVSTFSTWSNDIFHDVQPKMNGNYLVNSFVSATKKFADSDFVGTMRNLGSYVENYNRARIFTQAVKDGFGFKEAGRLANATMFDYSRSTAFEKMYLKRVFPFWTFMKNNAAAQIESTLRYPGRTQAVMNIHKALYDQAVSGLNPQQKEDFNSFKDDFINNAFALPMGSTKDGKLMWMTGFGIGLENAINLVSNPGGELAFGLNPTIKKGSEIVSALSQHTTPIKEHYDFSELPKVFPGIIKKGWSDKQAADFINSKEFQAHPLARFLSLRVAPKDVYVNGQKTGETRQVVQIDKGIADMLSNFLMGRAWATSKMLNSPDLDETDKFMRFTTGLQLYKQTVDKSIYGKMAQTRENVETELRQSGQGGGQGTKPYTTDPNATRLIGLLRRRY